MLLKLTTIIAIAAVAAPAIAAPIEVAPDALEARFVKPSDTIRPTTIKQEGEQCGGVLYYGSITCAADLECVRYTPKFSYCAATSIKLIPLPNPADGPALIPLPLPQ